MFYGLMLNLGCVAPRRVGVFGDDIAIRRFFHDLAADDASSIHAWQVEDGPNLEAIVALFLVRRRSDVETVIAKSVEMASRGLPIKIFYIQDEPIMDAVDIAELQSEYPALESTFAPTDYVAIVGTAAAFVKDRLA